MDIDHGFVSAAGKARPFPLHLHHNDNGGVWNHQPHGCLLNRLFRRRSKKTWKLRVAGFCAWNSPGPGISPHKGPITRKMVPFDDDIMPCGQFLQSLTAGSLALYSTLRLPNITLCSPEKLSPARFARPCGPLEAELCMLQVQQTQWTSVDDILLVHRFNMIWLEHENI